MEGPVKKYGPEILPPDDMVHKYDLRQNNSSHVMCKALSTTRQKQQTMHQKQTTNLQDSHPFDIRSPNMVHRNTNTHQQTACQNRMLRTIVNAPYDTIHRDLRIQTLDEHIHKITAISLRESTDEQQPSDQKKPLQSNTIMEDTGQRPHAKKFVGILQTELKQTPLQDEIWRSTK